MRAFLCEEKSLATNLMRGKLIKRANFWEHYKKCVHLFANKKLLASKEQIGVILAIIVEYFRYSVMLMMK